MQTNNTRIEVLSKNNYDTWKIHMEALLIKNDAWSYVTGATVKPEVVAGNDGTVQAAARWEINDLKARSDIILCIDSKELKQVKGCKTSREVWMKLQNTYQSTGPARKGTLLRKLALYRMENGGNMKEHLNKFFDIVDKLNEMEIEINKDLLAVLLLYSLPQNFENFRCAIESRDELPSPEALKIKILEEYEARNNQNTHEDQEALLAGKNFQNNLKMKNNKEFSKYGKFKYNCHKCGKKGHMKKDCPEKEQSHNAEDVSLYSAIETNTNEAFGGIHESKESEWCLDSGCTSHFCKDKRNFIEINENEVGKLNLANNVSTDVTARTGNSFLNWEQFKKFLR